VIELIGITARDPELIVESPGQEREFAHRMELANLLLELLWDDGRPQAHIDQRVEIAAYRAEVNNCRELCDHVVSQQPPHAVSRTMRAQIHLFAQPRERGSSVSHKQIEDSEVNLV
jgi:hypothetical protein